MAGFVNQQNAAPADLERLGASKPMILFLVERQPIFESHDILLCSARS